MLHTIMNFGVSVECGVKQKVEGEAYHQETWLHVFDVVQNNIILRPTLGFFFSRRPTDILSRKKLLFCYLSGYLAPTKSDYYPLVLTSAILSSINGHAS